MQIKSVKNKLQSLTVSLSKTKGRTARALARLAGAALLSLAAVSAQAHFTDGFDRADGAALGNGWIEKSPAAFTLAGGEAAKQSVGTGYHDNIAYRPAGEDVADVEASVEIRFTSTASVGYPQLAARLQSATAGSAGQLDAYLLYVENSATRAILGRQTGSNFVQTLAGINLTTPLNTTDRFRLRLNVTGTNPVNVLAYVERLDGAIWQVIGQASVADAAANRIAAAGSVGFGGYVEGNYRYDNFARVDLGAVGSANPAPATAGLAPASATAGESGLTLIVYGSGFTTDSAVRWNGAARATTFVSTSELEAAITSADLASAGTAAVTVFNPAPGGGTSGAQSFTILNQSLPAPTITTLNPSAAVAGGSAFTLNVSGTNFTSDATVRWNGASRATTFVSSTQLQAAIGAADIAAQGTASITVLRASDSAVSNAQPFSIDPPAAPSNFTDSFARPDGDAIGNNWIEKSPSAFALANGEVVKAGPGASDYRNNVVYRPASEDILDVEAALEFRLLGGAVGYPQIFVRGLSGSIGAGNTLDAYLLYIDNGLSQARLARQRGGGYNVSLATLNLAPALNSTDRFRMRLRATGSNPVQLDAFIERYNGSAWQVIGQGSYSDLTAERISTAGSVGFSGYVETGYVYDNFSRAIAEPAPPNPAPATSALEPSSVAAGAGAQIVTVNGTGFAAGASVRWNGADRTTTFISSTQLQAQIPAADLAAAGSANVTAFNPAPGGGVSNAQTFTISSTASNPLPAASSLNPTSALAGSGSFTLIVLGTGFVNDSVVRWNGGNRATTFISAGELRATINAGDVSSSGSASVSVFSPAPGGGTSNAITFQVTATNPAPGVTSISPSSTTAGNPGFTLTVLGTNFTSGSTVRWNGANRTTTFFSSGELRAAVSASDIASAGTATVTVFTPAPGGGTSNSRTFTIVSPGSSNPLPGLGSISPNRAGPGSAPVVVSVTGSGFNATSIARWNGADRPTTLISSTQLQVTLSSGDLANATLGAITVFNPAPGGGGSEPAAFFVQDAALGLFVDSFNRIDAEVVGNGWAEKNPTAFYLQGNRVASRDTSSGFPQDVMVRPQGEDRTDVEASVEFIRLPNNPNVLEEANFPQLHTRVQRQELMTAYSINSYIFFIEDVQTPPGRAMFAINRAPPQSAGLNECYIAGVPLPTALVVGERYRLRLRTSGTSPVVLTGVVEHFTNGAWNVLASGTATHSASTQRDPSLFCEGGFMPPPITNSGAVGVAKWTNRTDTYDNFFWRDVDTGVVAPAIDQIAPQSANAGGPAFNLTVTGSGFTPNAVVRWNGASRTTTYVSTTQLTAAIPAADVASAGSATVTVFNPGNGLTSNGASFQILLPGGLENLSDSFTRTDGPALGNGWIEKNANAFSIVSGRAQKLATAGGDYRNNLAYRPAGEDVLNVEASMELRVQNTALGYPMLIARLQSGTASTVGGFDGYVLYMADTLSQAILGRQNGTGWDTAFATINLSQPLNLTDTYRLRLSALGTNPVNLQAYIERLNGSTWTVIGQASYADSAPERIATPGSVGFTGYVESSYAFDNFRRTVFGN